MEVDDLVQETLIRAYKELDGFVYRSPGSFFRWLACIADHVVVDAARFEGRRKRRAQANVPLRSPSNPNGPEPVDTRTPSRIYAGREKLDRLLEVLDALPENYRQAIMMAKVEGLSTSEMAEKLGKTREATALLLHRALKQIRSIQQSEPA
jgi:RNA polymerase sigma-70 factor (ECF subfamily)